MLKTVSSITNAIGALNYKGTWNASTNTPTLADGTGAKGDYYVVSTAGTQTFDGILLFFGAGDWIVYNGAVWQRVEGGSDGNFSNVTLNSTDAGATAGPLLDLYRNSASPAASDTIGEIEFNGQDSAGNKQQYALIHGSILSPTSTTEQGQIHFETATAGASTEKMIIGTTNLVINEIGAVFNVRIEGDTDANLFYTDATNDRIGVGTISPSVKFEVNGAAKASSLSLTTALPATSGGTGSNSAFTANGVVYASSTSALATSSNLTWNGTTFINAAGPIQSSAGAYSSFYCTNQDGAYPSNYINTAGGDNQISFASNWFSGQRDLSIINSNIAGNGFGFYQMTGASAKTRLAFTNTGTFEPGVDNTMTLGSASYRWTTVYATTALINTSDVNDKQQIEDLTSAEIAVAKKLKDLFKSYKFNSAVAEKGDNARIHIGLMAQDVQQAFIDKGLNPNKYALFCSDTWQEYNGQPVLVDDENMYSVVTGYKLDGQTFTLAKGNVAPENSTAIFTKMPTQTVTKLGLRYTEVMAFLMAAVAQELNFLTARLSALETK